MCVNIVKTADSLVDIIKWRAENQTEGLAYQFIDYLNISDSKKITYSYSELDAKCRHIAALLQEFNASGKPVLIMYPPGLDYITAYFGCLYAKSIAVPCYPPLNPSMLLTLNSIVKNSGACHVLTIEQIENKVHAELDSENTLKSLKWISTDKITDNMSTNFKDVIIRGEDIAFLQYTSGSTSVPKGVMVAHENLIHNSEHIYKGFKLSSESRMLVWLPPYHDMGLIGGIIQPLYGGFPGALMAPASFIRKPVRWLQAITEFGATISGGPNFAYDFCVKKVSEEDKRKLNLSKWDLAFNGAEPIRLETLKRFSEAFSSCGFSYKKFCPCYGLAESTLMVTVAEKEIEPVSIQVDNLALAQSIAVINDNEESLWMVSSGKVRNNIEVAIVDSETNGLCSDDHIGEIWVKGPSVAKGYLGNETATEETFKGYLKDGYGPYLKTGDLGFFHDNELYISGRIKDLIIIRGNNYYPQDIELLVEKSDSGFRQGRIAAFSVEQNGEERLVIIAENNLNNIKNSDESLDSLFSSIVQSVSDKFQINIHEILIVKTSTLPVTTSGKIQRRATKQMYLEGSINAIAQWNFGDVSKIPVKDIKTSQNIVIEKEKSNEIRNWLKEKIAQKAKINEDDINENLTFGQYGLSSIDFIDISGELEEWLQCTLPPTIFYDYSTIPSLSEYITSFLEGGKEQTEDSKANNLHKGDIAIIGIDVRLPGAKDHYDFWENLKNGVCSISEIPSERWKWQDYELMSLDGEGKSPCKWAGLINNVDTFDSEFFDISLDETYMMDPQQRILLESVWRAIEDGAYNPHSLSGTRTGVFLGMSSSDYAQVLNNSKSELNAYSATGLAHSIAANRISYAFNFNGPSEVVDTACSSSLVALNHAVKALQAGECDMAIAGGINLLLSPTNFTALKRAGVLSEDGRCFSFDKSANGYVRSEGVSIILLKPLDKAVLDKDPIYGVIKGVGQKHGGKSNTLTSPNSNVQSQLIYETYKNSGISPDTVTYIEAHGTGTLLGDPMEVNGLKRSFDLLAKHFNNDMSLKNYCGIGSVKTNIGHLEAASGMASLIKVLLSLKHKVIPPLLNFKELNSYIDINDSSFYIANQLQEWNNLSKNSENVPLRAGINSFGFGGLYAHVILEEYIEGCTVKDQRSELEIRQKEYVYSQVIALSARSEYSLLDYISVLLKFLSSKHFNEIKLGDLAYTLQTSREDFGVRIAVITDSLEDLKVKLEAFLNGSKSVKDVYRSENICTNIPDNTKLQKYIEDKNLIEIAKLWVSGSKVEWRHIYDYDGSRRIHIPTYCFEKKIHKIPSFCDNASKEGIVKALGSNDLSMDEIIVFLTNEVSKISKIPVSEINVEKPLNDFGLSSIDVINIYGKLSAFIGREVPTKIIFECPDILSISKYVYFGKTDNKLDLISESTLDESIVPGEIPETWEINNILMTGSTGYFGGYLLRQLINDTDYTIYCLVRAKDQEDGLKRIKDNLQNNGILDLQLNSRVRVVLGDLTKEYLGLSKDEFDKISLKIDAIYHCGALVDWMRPYAALKASNVIGTHEILRLACHKKVKPVHHMSTVAVIPMQEDNYAFSEARIENPEGIIGGYGQSKWVAEELCFIAKERGLPVSIHRFDFAVGTSQNGIMKDGDFIPRLIRGLIELECVPEEEFIFSIIAVDQLCEIIVMLSSVPDNFSKVFNIVHTKPLFLSDYIYLLENRGYRLNKVPFEHWKTLIHNHPDKALYPLYPFINQYNHRELAYFKTWKISTINMLYSLVSIDPEYLNKIPSPREILDKVISNVEMKMNTQYTHHQFDNSLMYWKTNEEVCLSKEGNSIGRKTIEINKQVMVELDEVANSLGVSRQDVLFAVISIINSRYSLKTKVSLAVPICDKAFLNESVTEKFINLLFIKEDLYGAMKFKDLIYKIHNHLKDVYNSRKIYKNDFTSGYKTNLVHECMVCFKYNSSQEDFESEISLGDYNFHDINLESKIGYELDFTETGLSAAIKYNINAYSENGIDKVVSHFKSLLDELEMNLDLQIYTLQSLNI